MKPKVGDIVTMADGFDEGILGIVLEEEENHYYGFRRRQDLIFTGRKLVRGIRSNGALTQLAE